MLEIFVLYKIVLGKISIANQPLFYNRNDNEIEEKILALIEIKKYLKKFGQCGKNALQQIEICKTK